MTLWGVVAGLLVGCCIADINPGQIGLEFFGNEHAHTDQVFDFPTMQFTLTLRVKGSSGNLLSYGLKRGSGFVGSVLALQDLKDLRVFIGTNEWATKVNLADGDWHALALTWDMQTGEVRLFKDGNFVDSKTLAKGVPMPVDGYLVLGQQQQCAVGCFVPQTGFVGTLADITLWDKVLTNQQVSYLSTDSPAGDESGLVSFWPLNDMDSVQGRDSSRAAHNPIRLGGATWAPEVGMGEGSVSLSLHGYGALVVQPQSDLPTGDLTIEFWVKTTSMDNTVLLSYLMGDGTNPLVLRNPPFLSLSHNKETISLDTSVATGAWNHIAISWTQANGRVRVYKNSVQTYPPAWLPEEAVGNMPTLDLGGALPPRPARLVLGHNLTCATGSCLPPSGGFDGYLQDVRIWSTVRSREQVQQDKDHFLSTDPLPEGLALNLRLNELNPYQRIAADSSTKGNVGVLTVPLWKNSVIAPPLPTLEELNGKVAAMKQQMNDLFNFVKDVIDPPSASVITPSANGSLTVPNAGKCDRRYKYLCTPHTIARTPPANTAAAPSQPAAKPALTNVNLLVQRAMHRRQGALFEQLAPPVHAHTRELLQSQPLLDQPAPAAPAAQVLSEMNLLQQPEAKPEVSFPRSFARVDPSATTVVSSDAQPSVTHEGRQRHAWAVGTRVAANPKREIVAPPVSALGTSLKPNSRVQSHAVPQAIHVTQTQTRSNAGIGSKHHSHNYETVAVASADVKQSVSEVKHESNDDDEDSVAGFLEEAETEQRSVVPFDSSAPAAEDNEVDDMGPEALVHLRQAALSQAKSQHPTAPVSAPAPVSKHEPVPAPATAPVVAADSHKSSKTKAEEAEESEDLARLQAEFEQERMEFDSFNAEDKPEEFPQGWNFDEASAPSAPVVIPEHEATHKVAPAPKDVQAMLQEDEGMGNTPDHHHRHNNNKVQSAPEQAGPIVREEKNGGYHLDMPPHHTSHHHHRHHHHSHPVQQPRPEAAAPAKRAQQQQQPERQPQQQEQEQAAPQEKKAVVGDQEDDELSLVNTRKQALKTAEPANTKPVDNGGIGGKFEQLVMSGSENEWDEAIAAGVGNSDLATDDVDAQAAGDAL